MSNSRDEMSKMEKLRSQECTSGQASGLCLNHQKHSLTVATSSGLYLRHQKKTEKTRGKLQSIPFNLGHIGLTMHRESQKNLAATSSGLYLGRQICPEDEEDAPNGVHIDQNEGRYTPLASGSSKQFETQPLLSLNLKRFCVFNLLV